VSTKRPVCPEIVAVRERKGNAPTGEKEGQGAKEEEMI